MSQPLPLFCKGVGLAFHVSARHTRIVITRGSSWDVYAQLVLIRHTVDLQLAVKESLTPLGAQLLKLSLPTSIEKSETPTDQFNNERGADLVRYVQNKVRQDPRHYDAFVGALKSDLSQYSDILTKLEQARLPQVLELQPVIPHHPLREGGNRLSAQGMMFIVLETNIG